MNIDLYVTKHADMMKEIATEAGVDPALIAVIDAQIRNATTPDEFAHWLRAYAVELVMEINDLIGPAQDEFVGLRRSKRRRSTT